MTDNFLPLCAQKKGEGLELGAVTLPLPCRFPLPVPLPVPVLVPAFPILIQGC